MSQINPAPAPEPMFSRLRDLHRTLLRLHKILLDSERDEYENQHGRVTAHQLLQLVIGHEHFNWLHAISELIVRIDETMEADDPPTSPDEFEALLAYSRSLLQASPDGNDFQRKYDAALQRNPNAVMAHREVTRVLSG